MSSPIVTDSALMQRFELADHVVAAPPSLEPTLFKMDLAGALSVAMAPFIAMLGAYAPVTAPALVLVGAMMLRNVAQIAWDDFTELLPAFLLLVGIPLSYSIADGLALGFISYPIVKVLGGRGCELRWMSWFIAGLVHGRALHGLPRP